MDGGVCVVAHGKAHRAEQGRNGREEKDRRQNHKQKSFARVHPDLLRDFLYYRAGARRESRKSLFCAIPAPATAGGLGEDCCLSIGELN